MTRYTLSSTTLPSLLLLTLLLTPTPTLAQSNATVNPHIDNIPSVPQSTACTDVHIFLAKGNNETESGQRQLKLVDAICSSSPTSNTTCAHESIHFTNSYETLFCASLEEGAANGQTQLIEYAEKCPESKIVVAGYSQGAQVVGDIFGGGGGTFFQDCVQKSNKGLDPKDSSHSLGKQIVAVSLCGDTRHTANQKYNVLSGAGNNGLFPREGEQLEGLGKWTSVLRNYCAVTDPICAEDSGEETNGEAHLSYFDVYSQDIAKWVWEKVQAAADEPSSTTSSSTSSSSTSATKTSSSSAEASETADENAEPTSTTTIPTSSGDVVGAAASQSEAAAGGASRMVVSLGVVGLPLLAILGMM